MPEDQMRNPILSATWICGVVFTFLFVGCSSQDATEPPAIPQSTPTVGSTSVPVAVATNTAEPAPELELVWQMTGDPNPFKVPVGVTVDSQGNVYVMDTETTVFRNLTAMANSY